MVTAVIGALRVDLDLGTSGWTQGLSRAQRDAKQLEGKLDGIGSTMTKVGGIATAGLTVPLVGLGAAAIKTAGNFETAMQRLGIATQASAGQMKSMNDLALELGKTTVFSASEAATAMEELAKTGVSVEDILGGAAKAAVDLASATGSELAPSATAVSDAMNQFGLSAKDLPMVVNQITGAVNESKLDFADFQLGMAQAGGVAGGLGVTFKDFNAVLAGTSSLFSSGSDAGTSFKTFLTSFVPKSKAAAAAMQEYGLSFFDANGKMKSMSDVAQMLQEKLGGLSDEAKNDVLKEIFGSDAMRTAIGLMKLGGDGLDNIAAKIAKTDAAAQSAQRMKGFNAQLEQLGGSLETLAIKIGQTGLLESATSFIGLLGEMVDKISDVSPMALQLGVGIAAIAAAFGPVMMIFGPAISAIGSLITLFTGWGAALGAASAAAGGLLPLLAPFLPILAGVAAAVGAVYLAWKNWDSIAPILQSMWDGFVAAVGPAAVNLFNALKEAVLALWAGPFGQLIRGVIGVIGEFGALVARVIGAEMPGIFKALGAAVGLVFNTIANVVRLVVALLSGDWAGAWNAAKALVVDFAKGIGGILGGLWEAAKAGVISLVKTIDQWMGGTLSAIWNKVKAGIDAVKGWFFGLYDAVVGHSYIPDMVDGIAGEMLRLDDVMVDRAKKATKATADAFRALAGEVAPLLDRLFPDQKKLADYKRDLDLIAKAEKAGPGKGGIDAATASAARDALRKSNPDAAEKVEGIPAWLINPPDLVAPVTDVSKALDDLIVKLPDLGKKSQEETAKMVESFAGMARDVLGSLRGMVSAFKGGDILGGLTQLLDIVVQVAGMFKGGGTFRPSVNVTGGGYGGTRAMGGPVVAGKTYRVGERGPEWFTPATGGRISPDGGPSRGNTYHFSGNLLTPEFWAEIEARDSAAALQGATGGAQMAMERSQKRAQRRL